MRLLILVVSAQVAFDKAFEVVYTHVAACHN